MKLRNENNELTFSFFSATSVHYVTLSVRHNENACRCMHAAAAAAWLSSPAYLCIVFVVRCVCMRKCRDVYRFVDSNKTKNREKEKVKLVRFIGSESIMMSNVVRRLKQFDEILNLCEYLRQAINQNLMNHHRVQYTKCGS